jgi:hypothetical protein
MRLWTAIVAALLALNACAPAPGEKPGPEPLAEEAGAPFIEIAVDATAGKVLATLPPPDGEGVMLRAIHTSGLAAGLGSNPVGLDRGFADSGRIIAFRKVGPNVAIEQENWTYRASADIPLEKRAVAESFARSFLWSGKVEEEKPDGAVVVDLSSFLTGDILGLKAILKQAGQGDYVIAAERSFPDYASVLVFPDNVEMEAFVTLVADNPGDEIAATAADGRAFTLTVHHSLVRLPEEGFKTRDFDPRAAAIDVPYYDFSAGLDAPVVKRFARRFRLEKTDPAAAKSAVKKPIVYYVDPGAPEPIRSALVDGASWWAEAFEAAGFEGGYRVELLPEDANPMDVRYNVIQWVHRQTRGWSYGGGVFDPRTGEMLKAHVVLGSQRVRQDRMIFEGLAGAAKTGTGAADDPVELALARIRQLAAHEVGHTLGFAHNFAASVNDRASVMDYPAPWVRPTPEGGLDFSQSYAVGMGAWDKVTVDWLYSEYPAGADEKAALNRIIMDAYGSGLRFVDDAQGRAVSGANPVASVWDNSADPVAALDETMQVRAIALRSFGLRSVRDGEPVSRLREIIVPVYLYHRYQVDAAAKLIGGYDFRYGMKGDGAPPAAPVPAVRQRAALAAIIATLDPAALDLPDATLDQLKPPIESFGARLPSESFGGDTGAMFDILAAADAAGSGTLQALLHPARAARLVEMERRDPAALSLDDVLSAVEARLFANPASPRQAEIYRRLETRYVSILIDMATGETPAGASQALSLFLSGNGGPGASSAVMARTDAYLRALRGRLQPGLLPTGDNASRAHRAWLAARIDAHLARPAPSRIPSADKTPIPPGSPIGMTATEECWFCDLN